MHARLVAEGPGLFLDLGQDEKRARHLGARSRPVVGAYAYETSWSHPSQGGARLVPTHAESRGEERRRRAECAVLDALRLCDAADALDSVTLSLGFVSDSALFESPESPENLSKEPIPRAAKLIPATTIATIPK